MKFKESTLKLYAAPLSSTEDEKCKHAIEQIRDALKNLGYTDDDKGIGLLESDTLAYSVSMRGMYSKEKIHIFIQGSYANNTCVRNESDVDIAIVREDDHDSAYGENMRIVTANKKIEAMKLKDNVERTLKIKFPNNQVHRKNKSIKVDGNTYRKQVDTVPCIAMNYYYRSHLYDYVSYHDGVIIFAAYVIAGSIVIFMGGNIFQGLFQVGIGILIMILGVLFISLTNLMVKGIWKALVIMFKKIGGKK